MPTPAAGPQQALSRSPPLGLLLRACHRWAAPGDSSAAVEKLRAKIARNLNLGWKAFLTKGFGFAKSAAASRYLLREVDELGVGVRVVGRAPKIENRGRIVLGDDVVLSAPVTPIYLELKPKALLRIGAETWINDGVWFGCTERITIGRRALLGPGVRIFDNSYHDVYQRHRLPAARPVTIGDDVWIASDAIILPGVTIGAGAIIGAGTVVHEDVAPFSIVSGNPARVIKKLSPRLFEQLREP